MSVMAVLVIGWTGFIVGLLAGLVLAGSRGADAATETARLRRDAFDSIEEAIQLADRYIEEQIKGIRP